MQLPYVGHYHLSIIISFVKRRLRCENNTLEQYVESQNNIWNNLFCARTLLVLSRCADRAVGSTGGALPNPHSAATWHKNSIHRGLCACVCQCQPVSVYVCVSLLTPEIFCYSLIHDTLNQYNNIKCCIKDRLAFRCM